MPISWNEIRRNAIAFASDWADVSREDAEAQTFWNEFFAVFGIKRRTVASFEEPIKKLSGNWGFIDLFWPATVLVEHKSRGQSLDKAESQAMEYIHGLKNAGRDDEIPRYVIVSDFARIAVHDLEESQSAVVELQDLHSHADKFAFIPGYQQHKLDPDDPIDIRAVGLLGDLRDALEDGGYVGHDLERFLVRVLFCLFAENTDLFDRKAFTHFIENHSSPDGSNLGAQLARLFEVLNTPEDKRQKHLLEELAGFRYVNGELFAEALNFADFNRDMRNRLLVCCRFDWSRISPAIFGSLFQSLFKGEARSRERRQIGAHYTSERDILKVVRSLFLDELRAEFERRKSLKGTQRTKKLKEFHTNLGSLKFLDPACGCGNFLVVTYRELRLLEIDVLKALNGRQQVTDIQLLSVIDVDAMYGIEINEFPARIAEVALWLVDHQMNQRLSEAFGQYLVRLPLRKSATILVANALRIDWDEVLPANSCSYVLGNPPFVGKHLMTGEQSSDMKRIWGELHGLGVLDYVTAWYRKAASYIGNKPIQVAFVSTNSISQGEQVPVLWSTLFAEGVQIDFAHTTFPWESEARGAAHVHVVIIGFSRTGKTTRTLTEYSPQIDDEGERTFVGTTHTVANISPYLFEGSNCLITSRQSPLCRVPKSKYGSKPVDGGFLIVEEEHRKTFLATSPAGKKYLRPLLCADEYLNGIPRWCIWLVDANPRDWRSDKTIYGRVKFVREYRLKSKKKTTREAANLPSVFAEVRQPTTSFLVIPQHTSERRKYVPFGFFTPDVIVHNSCTAVPDATLFHFGVLTSLMHMTWVRHVCGRIKSDYRYSTKLVYNNFPWPERPTPKQISAVESKAQAVLDARAGFPDSSLAQLYDPASMPAKLTKAHRELDRAVDKCYRSQQFQSDRERIEFLFALYEKLTSPITAGLEQPKTRRVRRK